MEKVVAIKCGTLIDGTGNEPLRDAVVLIEDSKITEVGEKLTVPQGAKVVNATGKTVMPGLIDGHVHLNTDQWGDPYQRLLERLILPDSMVNLRAAKNARIALEAGYTSILGNIGWGNYADLFLKEAIDNGWVSGPRLWTSGPSVSSTTRKGKYIKYGLPRRPYEMADGVEELRKLIRSHVVSGVDWIKVLATYPTAGPGEPAMTHFNAEELRVIMEEAHAQWKKVKAHLEGSKTTKEALDAGVDIVLHGYFLDEDDVEFMSRKKVWYIPTMGFREVSFRTGAPGRPEWYLQKVKRYTPIHRASFKRARDAGVLIAAGSDCGPAYIRHGNNAKELEFLVMFSLSPMEAIMAGTKNVAEAFGLSSLIGTIETGKFADIVIIDGDPLKDINILQDKNRILMVFKNGDIVVDHGVSRPCRCPPLQPYPPGFLAKSDT